MPRKRAESHVIPLDLWEAMNAIEWLNLSEAAQLVGVSVGSFHAAADAGRIAALSSVNENGHRAWLFPRSEVEHYRDTRGRGGAKGRSGRHPDPLSRRSQQKQRALESVAQFQKRHDIEKAA